MGSVRRLRPLSDRQISLDTRKVVGADFLAALCARKIHIGCLKMAFVEDADVPIVTSMSNVLSIIRK